MQGMYSDRDHSSRPSNGRTAVNEDNHRWFASAKRYEINPEQQFGDEDRELEEELFSKHHNTGINFDKYDEVKVKVNGIAKPEPLHTFKEAGFHPIIEKNLSLSRYEKPTPVQRYCIPIVMSGVDVLGSAQTGSGKTSAYILPILHKLLSGGMKEYKCTVSNICVPSALILAPTRELACQIYDETRRFTYRTWVRPYVAYGGCRPNIQISYLTKGAEILSATPGRLLDFVQRGIVDLTKVKFLVVDEADRMLDFGFEKDLRKLLELGLCGDRQTIMLSATFPKPIRKLARDFLRKKHVFISVGRVGSTSLNITQKIMYVEEHRKQEALLELLFNVEAGLTLIFTETKRGADRLDHFLFQNEFPVTSIHGDRTQAEREDALLAFKTGKAPIMVATAVASRGLDIPNVVHVINYDLCKSLDEYVHRIGRTGRVGNKGRATSFYNERNSDIASDVTKLLVECKQEIPDFLQQYVPVDSPENLFTDFGEDDEDVTETRFGYDEYGRKIPRDMPNRDRQNESYQSGPVIGWEQSSEQSGKGWGDSSFGNNRRNEFDRSTGSNYQGNSNNRYEQKRDEPSWGNSQSNNGGWNNSAESWGNTSRKESMEENKNEGRNWGASQNSRPSYEQNEFNNPPRPFNRENGSYEKSYNRMNESRENFMNSSERPQEGRFSRNGPNNDSRFSNEFGRGQPTSNRYSNNEFAARGQSQGGGWSENNNFRPERNDYERKSPASYNSGPFNPESSRNFNQPSRNMNSMDNQYGGRGYSEKSDQSQWGNDNNRFDTSSGHRPESRHSTNPYLKDREQGERFGYPSRSEGSFSHGNPRSTEYGSSDSYNKGGFGNQEMRRGNDFPNRRPEFSQPSNGGRGRSDEGGYRPRNFNNGPRPERPESSRDYSGYSNSNFSKPNSGGWANTADVSKDEKPSWDTVTPSKVESANTSNGWGKSTEPSSAGWGDNTKKPSTSELKETPVEKSIPQASAGGWENSSPTEPSGSTAGWGEGARLPTKEATINSNWGTKPETKTASVDNSVLEKESSLKGWNDGDAGSKITTQESSGWGASGNNSNSWNENAAGDKIGAENSGWNTNVSGNKEVTEISGWSADNSGNKEVTESSSSGWGSSEAHQQQESLPIESKEISPAIEELKSEVPTIEQHNIQDKASEETCAPIENSAAVESLSKDVEDIDISSGEQKE